MPNDDEDRKDDDIEDAVLENDPSELGSVSDSLIKDLGETREAEGIVTRSSAHSQEKLQETMYTFFEDAVKRVDDEQEIMQKLNKSFSDDLDSNVLDFSERMSLFQMLSARQNNQISSIISLFKPAPGAPSVFVEKVAQTTEKTALEKTLENTSPDELQSFSVLIDALQKLDNAKDGNGGEDGSSES